MERSEPDPDQDARELEGQGQGGGTGGTVGNETSADPPADAWRADRPLSDPDAWDAKPADEEHYPQPDPDSPGPPPQDP
jgi:hypothetical protein